MASIKFDISADHTQAIHALQQLQAQANKMSEQMKIMSNFKLPAASSLADSMDSAARHASKVNEELKGMDKVANAVGGSVSNFAQQFTVAQLAVEGINKAINAIRSSWGYLTSFQTANQSLSMVTGKSKEDLSALIQSAKEFGAASIFSASQVTQLQTALSRLGFQENEILSMTKSLIDLATVSGLAPEKAATELATIMRMFGATAGEAGKLSQALGYVATKSAVDISTLTQGLARFAPTAQQFGMSVNDILAMVMKLSEAGIKGSRAMMSLNSVFYKMSQSKVSGLVDVRSFDDFIGRLKNLGQDSAQFQKTMKDVGAMGSSIFGPLIKSAQDAEGGILSLRDKLNEVGESAAGDNLSDMSAKMTNTVSGALAMLESTWERFVLEIGESSLGPVKDSIDFISNAIDQVTKLVNGDFEDISAATYLVVGALGVLTTAILGTQVANAGARALTAAQVANYEALEVEVTKMTTLKGGEMDATMAQAVAEGKLTEAQVMAISSALAKAEATNIELEGQRALIAEKTKALQQELEIATVNMNAAETYVVNADAELKAATAAYQQAVAEEQAAKGTSLHAQKVTQLQLAQTRLLGARADLATAEAKQVAINKQYGTVVATNTNKIEQNRRAINGINKSIATNSNGIKTITTNVDNMGKQSTSAFANIGRGIRSVGAAILTSPLLWIAGTIWAVSSAISYFKESANTSERAIKGVNDAFDALNKKQEGAKTKYEELIRVCNDENASLYEKIDAYTKIKELYEEFGKYSPEEFLSLSKEEQDKIFKAAQKKETVQHAQSFVTLYDRLLNEYGLTDTGAWHAEGHFIRKNAKELGLSREEYRPIQETMSGGTQIGYAAREAKVESIEKLHDMVYDEALSQLSQSLNELGNDKSTTDNIRNDVTRIRNMVVDMFNESSINVNGKIEIQNVEETITQLKGLQDIYTKTIDGLERQKNVKLMEGDKVGAANIEKQIKSYERLKSIVESFQGVLFANNKDLNSLKSAKDQTEKLLKEYNDIVGVIDSVQAKLNQLQQTGDGSEQQKESLNKKLDNYNKKLEDLVGDKEPWGYRFDLESLLEFIDKEIEAYGQGVFNDDEMLKLSVAVGFSVSAETKAQLENEMSDVKEKVSDFHESMYAMANLTGTESAEVIEKTKSKYDSSFQSLNQSVNQSKANIQKRIDELNAKLDTVPEEKKADIRADIFAATKQLTKLEQYWEQIKIALQNPAVLNVVVKWSGQSLEQLAKRYLSVDLTSTPTQNNEPGKGNPDAESEAERKKREQAEKAKAAAEEKARKAKATAEQKAQKAKETAERKAQQAAEKARREQEKREQAAEKLADKMVDAELRLQDLNNSLIKADFIRERAELTTKWERDIKKLNDDLKEADRLSQQAGKGSLSADKIKVFKDQINARTALYDEEMRDLGRKELSEFYDVMMRNISSQGGSEELADYMNSMRELYELNNSEEMDYIRRRTDGIEKERENILKQNQNLKTRQNLTDNEKGWDEQKRQSVIAENNMRFEALEAEMRVIQQRAAVIGLQKEIVENEFRNKASEQAVTSMENTLDWARTFEGIDDIAGAALKNALNEIIPQVISETIETAIPVRDKKGNPVLDEDGNQVYRYETTRRSDRFDLVGDTMADAVNNRDYTVGQYKRILAMRKELDLQLNSGLANVSLRALGQDVNDIYKNYADLRHRRQDDNLEEYRKAKQARANGEDVTVPELPKNLSERDLGEVITDLILELKNSTENLRKSEEELDNLRKSPLKEGETQEQRDAAIKQAEENVKNARDAIDSQKKQIKDQEEARKGLKEANDLYEKQILEAGMLLATNAQKMKEGWENILSGVQELGSASSLGGVWSGLQTISKGIGDYKYKAKQYEKDEKGEYKRDEKGNKIAIYEKDENGNDKLDAKGRKIQQEKSESITLIDAISGPLVDVFTDAVEGFGKGLGTVINGIGSIFGNKELGEGLKNALSSVSESLGNMPVGQAASLVMTILEILSDGLENLIANLLTTVINALTGIITTLTDPKVWIEAMKGVVKAFQGLGKSLFNSLSGGIFSWSGGNAEKVAKREAELSEKLEQLTKSMDKLKETLKSGQGFKSIKAFEEAIELQEEIVETQKERVRNKFGYHDAHHSLMYELNGLSSEDFALASRITGQTITKGGDFFELTPEQWRDIQANAGLYAEMKSHGSSNYWKRFEEYLDAYVDMADTIPELEDQLRESLTQTSFEGLRDSFISTLMDMDADAETFSENFSEYMMKAMLTNKVGELMNDRLEDFWKDWAEKSKSGYSLTDGEIADLKAQYEGIAEEGLRMRDELAQITGYDQSTSTSGTSKGVQGMTQDTAEELNGRFTALQIAGEAINAQMAMAVGQLMMIGQFTTESNTVLSDLRAISISSNSYLADIAKYNKSIYVDFSEKLDKVINNTNRL